MYQEYKSAWAALTAPGADFEVTTTNVRGVDIRTYANASKFARCMGNDCRLPIANIWFKDERLTYAQALTG